MPVPRRRFVPILLIAAAAVFFLFPVFSGLLTDWWWFREIGYQIIYVRELTTRVLLFLVVGGITAGVLYLNLWFAQRGLVPHLNVQRLRAETPTVKLTMVLRQLSRPVSLVLGVLAGFAATPAWDL